MVPRHLTLDFNPAPRVRRLRRIALGLGVVALIAGGVDFGLAWKARMEATGELASLNARRPGRAAGAGGSADAAALRAATSIVRDLRAPWPELMRAMEASRNNDISLIQIEPVVARDTIRITGDARNPEAMLDYLDKLRAHGLTEVVLTSHQVREKEPGTPIRFQAQARWTSLTPPAATAMSTVDSAIEPTDPERDTR